MNLEKPLGNPILIPLKKWFWKIQVMLIGVEGWVSIALMLLTVILPRGGMFSGVGISISHHVANIINIMLLLMAIMFRSNTFVHHAIITTDLRDFILKTHLNAHGQGGLFLMIPSLWVIQSSIFFLTWGTVLNYVVFMIDPWKANFYRLNCRHDLEKMTLNFETLNVRIFILSDCIIETDHI